MQPTSHKHQWHQMPLRREHKCNQDRTCQREQMAAPAAPAAMGHQWIHLNILRALPKHCWPLETSMQKSELNRGHLKLSISQKCMSTLPLVSVVFPNLLLIPCILSSLPPPPASLRLHKNPSKSPVPFSTLLRLLAIAHMDQPSKVRRLQQAAPCDSSIGHRERECHPQVSPHFPITRSPISTHSIFRGLFPWPQSTTTTSLPPELVPSRLRHLAHVVSAYNICLRLEKSLQNAIDKGEDVGQDIIIIQILGYLVHFVPTDRGLKKVVQEISSCEDEFTLFAVGKMYYDHYIPKSTSSTCYLTVTQLKA